MAGRNVGNLLIKLGVDNAELIKKINKSEKRLSRFSKTALKATARIAAVGAAVGGAFTIKAARAAAQYEKTRKVFETFIGSVDGANKVLRQLDDFARTTPFQLPEIERAAKTLLGFGIAAEDLIPTMSRLGDLSQGNGAAFAHLARVFGESRAEGKLLWRDIRQFVTQGVPLVQMLSESLGVAESEISEMTKKGEISFQELEEAIRMATDEGGMFFNLMETQSKTVSGLFSNLQDAVTIFFRKVGEFLLPTLRVAAKALLDIMDRVLESMGDAKDNNGPVIFAAKVQAAFATASNAIKGTILNVELLFQRVRQTIGQLQQLSGFSQLVAGAGIVGADSARGTISQGKTTERKAKARIESIRGELDNLRFTTMTVGEEFQVRFRAAAREIEAAEKAISSLNREMGGDKVAGGGGAGGGGSRRRGAISAPARIRGPEMPGFTDQGPTMMQSMMDKVIEMKGPAADLQAIFENWNEAQSSFNEKLGETASTVATFAGGLFESLDNGFKKFGQTMAKFFKDLIKNALKALFVVALTAAFTPGVSIAGVIKEAGGLISLLKGLSFAKGGIVSGPTMAMVGDNPNAHIDPEVVSPLSKLERMMRPSGGFADGQVVGQISADKLFLVWKQGAYRNRALGGVNFTIG